jgi:hypothetical protein
MVALQLLSTAETYVGFLYTLGAVQEIPVLSPAMMF